MTKISSTQNGLKQISPPTTSGPTPDTSSLCPDWAQQANATLKTFSKRINLARFVLIMLIVMLHFSMAPPDLESSPNRITLIYTALANSLLLLAVPLLSVISGFIFFARQSYLQPRRTIGNKIRTILVPFLIFNLPLVALVWGLQTQGYLQDNRIQLIGADITSWANALFAFQGRPVNYPLHFLRDLLVIFTFAALAGRLLVRFPKIALLACTCVAALNLDGSLILRNDILLCFVLGGVMAVGRINIAQADRIPAILATLALIGLCALFLKFPEQDLWFRVVGGCLVWPMLARLDGLMRYPIIARMTSYAFPVYLIHAIVIVFLFAFDIRAHPTPIGLMVWIFAPLVISAAIIGIVWVFQTIAPRLTGIALGGRVVAKGSKAVKM